MLEKWSARISDYWLVGFKISEFRELQFDIFDIYSMELINLIFVSGFVLTKIKLGIC